jgi:hypothetical protein
VKLYQARESFRPKDQLDIGVNAGDLVGVVQQKDPMGNRNRWFVDNGLTQGFVPSRVLAAIGENNHAPTREAEVIVATAAAGIAPEATARHQYDDVASEEVTQPVRKAPPVPKPTSGAAAASNGDEIASTEPEISSAVVEQRDAALSVAEKEGESSNGNAAMRNNYEEITAASEVSTEVRFVISFLSLTYFGGFVWVSLLA